MCLGTSSVKRLGHGEVIDTPWSSGGLFIAEILDVETPVFVRSTGLLHKAVGLVGEGTKFVETPPSSSAFGTCRELLSLAALDFWAFNFSPLSP
ncbi:unnamed protein product [Linum trigynum]